jgi:hypothetical protein
MTFPACVCDHFTRPRPKADLTSLSGAAVGRSRCRRGLSVTNSRSVSLSPVSSAHILDGARQKTFQKNDEQVTPTKTFIAPMQISTSRKPRFRRRIRGHEPTSAPFQAGRIPKAASRGALRKYAQANLLPDAKGEGLLHETQQSDATAQMNRFRRSLGLKPPE